MTLCGRGACRRYRYPVRPLGCNMNGTKAKAADNIRKHGVDFMDAIEALKDPNRLEEIDTRFPYDEERIQVIGMARGRLLFPAATFPRRAHLQDHIGPKGHET